MTNILFLTKYTSQWQNTALLSTIRSSMLLTVPPLKNKGFGRQENFLINYFCLVWDWSVWRDRHCCINASCRCKIYLICSRQMLIVGTVFVSIVCLTSRHTYLRAGASQFLCKRRRHIIFRLLFSVNTESVAKQTTFDISKFSLVARLRGHKQRKLNDHVYSFLLFVSSRPRYQAEF